MDNYTRKFLVGLAAFMVLSQSLMAEPLWSDLPAVDKDATAVLVLTEKANPHKNSRHVSVSLDQLKSTLASANVPPTGLAKKTLAPTQIDLPMPYGGLQTFNVTESSVMEPELAAKYPQIKTYKVVAANEPTVTGVLDTGPKGFHAYLHSTKGVIFIDPVAGSAQQEYYSYYKRDYVGTTDKPFSCGVKSQSPTESPVAELVNYAYKTSARTSGNLISYKLAVAATGEYSQAVKNPGSTTPLQIKDDALASIVTAISRVSFIYARDLAIRLVLVSDTNVIYTDGSTDPYSNDNASALLIENQANLDLELGPATYDIGHVFSTGGGGLAAVGVACLTNYKAKGETGLPDPTGEVFHIDFVAHEIGHQLGANHSFNGTSGNCGSGNRNAATAFEPGSGSTIMAYAGTCDVENTSINSIATFHAGSIAEIFNHTRNSIGSNCSVSLPGQVAPTVIAGVDYTIPGGTAFTLSGSAIDPESDVMFYQWDQMDSGKTTNSSTYGTDNGSNALFRSYLPVATAQRTFPALSTLLGNNPDPLAAKAETLPTENRTLNFRLTARDGNGGVGEDDAQVVVNGRAGPFELLQPTTNVTLDPLKQQSIQWNAACTNAAPINCANVDILLSTDGGTTFTSVVGGTTPNSGIALVTLPTGDTITARIKVACSDNIFFDISNVNFAITSSSGGSLPAGLIGGSYDCGTATIPPPSSSGVLSASWIFMLLFTPLLRLRHYRNV